MQRIKYEIKGNEKKEINQWNKELILWKEKNWQTSKKKRERRQITNIKDKTQDITQTL